MKKLLCALLYGGVVFCGFGESSHHLTVDELRRVRLPDVVLDSVVIPEDVRKHPGAPQYVEVKGTIAEHIRFELLLPDAWNQRFAMGGGGGFVGSVQNGARYSVNLGYATVGTDTGHQSSGLQAGWALDNVEAQLNFGYLAVHRTAAVAKALIRAYYNADPAYSYFLGCSRGGGQAMMESQRYPDDFDGIVAGAPAFYWTGFSACNIAIAQALYPDPHHLDTNILTLDALKKLQQGILDQCDAQDGLRDGIINDPPSAKFDLSKVDGLTDQQRKDIGVICGGVRNQNGLICPGFTAAAGCDPNNWFAWIVGSVPQLLASDHAPDLLFAFSTQVFKNFVFNRADWDYSTYNFSNFENDTRLAGSYLNATNPDLDAFHARHGKLILWHGWADPALAAQVTINYYRAVLAHDLSAANYCRLFLIPGCLHCGGGPGASEVDWLPIIADWVEHNQAPEKVIAAKKDNGKTLLTRPLVPYPQSVKYKGSGDPNNADSFVVK